VDPAQSTPRRGLAGRPEPVGAGVAGHVGLVDGDHRQPQPGRGHGAAAAEHERAGQVDEFGTVPGQRGAQARTGRGDPETGITGHRQRRHPHYRIGQGVVWPGQRIGRPGGDDQRVVASPDQVLGDAQDTVGHAVDVGGERFGDDRDPHDHTVQQARFENGFDAMKPRLTVADICFLGITHG